MALEGAAALEPPATLAVGEARQAVAAAERPTEAEMGAAEV